VESQRQPFIEECLRSVDSQSYCECSFGQFSELFRDEDFSQEMPKNDPRFQQLATQIQAHCLDKLPEASVRQGVVAGCVGEEPKKQAYCDCSWETLRKYYAVADILHNEPGSPEWLAGQRQVATACRGKFPAELAASDFLKACTAGGTKSAEQCSCAWKKVLKKYSIEDLVTNLADISKVPDLDQCR